MRTKVTPRWTLDTLPASSSPAWQAALPVVTSSFTHDFIVCVWNLRPSPWSIHSLLMDEKPQRGLWSRKEATAITLPDPPPTFSTSHSGMVTSQPGTEAWEDLSNWVETVLAFCPPKLCWSCRFPPPLHSCQLSEVFSNTGLQSFKITMVIALTGVL